MTIWAVMRTRFEGIHNYPKAPDEVSFLRHPHRHMFHVTVHLEQFHDNRDVEFLMFLTWLRSELFDAGMISIDGQVELGHVSCESLARKIALIINVKHPDRRLKIEVSEDGENGALLEGDMR